MGQGYLWCSRPHHGRYAYVWATSELQPSSPYLGLGRRTVRARRAAEEKTDFRQKSSDAYVALCRHNLPSRGTRKNAPQVRLHAGATQSSFEDTIRTLVEY